MPFQNRLSAVPIHGQVHPFAASWQAFLPGIPLTFLFVTVQYLYPYSLPEVLLFAPEVPYHAYCRESHSIFQMISFRSHHKVPAMSCIPAAL